MVALLITPLITTHEPPSRSCEHLRIFSVLFGPAPGTDFASHLGRLSSWAKLVTLFLKFGFRG